MSISLELLQKMEEDIQNDLIEKKKEEILSKKLAYVK